MTHLHLDFETGSRVDLKKQGLDRYARHSSTRVLMLSWKLDNNQTLLWQPHLGPMPPLLRKLILDPKVLKIAHNAQFERAILEHVLKMPTPAEHWHCTMVMSLSLALPAALGQLIKDALQLKKKYHKDARGEKLIQLFCYPKSTATWETHPKEWGEFCEYCIQDTEAEAKVYSILVKYVDNIDKLFRGWVIDQRINARGLPVDYDFIDQALLMAAQSKEEYRELMTEKTGLDNPNSTKQLLGWLSDKGYPFASLAKNRVMIAMKDFKDSISTAAHVVLQLRLDSNKTSLAKYSALRNASYGGRLRNIFQYFGAGATGRWAGRILGQNMPRPWGPIEDDLEMVRRFIADGDLEGIKEFFDKPMECLATSIRSAIKAPRGKKLVVADLASIELCVVAWLSGSKFWLDVIASGKDPYKAFAEKWLKVPYDLVTKAMRKLSKPPALGACYRLGPGEEKGEYPDTEKTGLWGYAANMGVELTKQQCEEAIATYREISPEIVQMWYDLENAAMKCVSTGEPQRVGPLSFDMKAPFLRMKLPSGRHLFYCRPRIGQVKLMGKEGKEYFKTSLSYERLNQTSRKWQRQYTHGGKFIEQCLSAESKVLTPLGLKRIVDVKLTDRLWDGGQWVRHGGLVRKGVQRTVDFGGVWLTPDHRVDVDGGWVQAGETTYEKAASSFGRHYGAPVSLLDGSELRRGERVEVPVGDSLRLRYDKTHGGVGVSQGADKILRVHARQADFGSEHNTREVSTPVVLGVAQYEGALLQPEPRGVSLLRGPGHNSVRRVVGVVRELLGRHGVGVRTWARDRSTRQRKGVWAEQLQVRVGAGQCSQHEIEHAGRNSERPNACVRSGGSFGDRGHNSSVQIGAELPGYAVVRQAERYEQVFDLKNSGPNNRFAVVGSDGRMFLAHNCTQAIARDLLEFGIHNAEKAELPVLASFHDEIICEVDEDVDGALELLINCMTQPPAWGKTIPLGAEGYVADFYRK